VTGAIARYLRTFTGFSRDARLFLLTTIVFGAALSLYWIDFNLYLESIGLGWAIGWLMAVSQLAGFLMALPASAISDRIGRRKVMACGMALVAVALFAFLPGDLPLMFVGVIALGAGQMAVNVVQVPFIAEHTRPEQRNEYFSLWSAIGFLTGLVAAIVGGLGAPMIASLLHLGSDAAPYQILLSGVAVLGTLSLGTVWLLTADEPAAGRTPATGMGRFGIVVLDRNLFFRLLLPGFLTSLGAGQLIPFLNVFIQTKFSLGLAEVNAVFAVSSLGTAVAILIQPAVARRFGRIGSIVLVQGASIPFLVVLGFSPVLWTVIGALAVRNSLMNAGGPIFDAFAMERISPAERATLSAGMTMLWALGWTIAPIYYGVLHAWLGFTLGFGVNFVTIIVLYTIATSLLWTWFRGTDKIAAVEADDDAAVAAASALAAEGPVALERA
jgi:MFS family permease